MFKISVCFKYKRVDSLVSSHVSNSRLVNHCKLNLVCVQVCELEHEGLIPHP